jgi:fatty-acyl-CoA synthase
VHPGRVAAFGVPNPRAGTEDVAIVAEVDLDDVEAKRAIISDIRRVVANGSDVAARYVELVERGWLIKTSSGKVARKANREKLLERLNHNKPG